MPVSRILLLLLMLLAAGPGFAAAKITPWMLADWENPAPHLADIGLKPKEIVDSIGQRMLLFPHPAREISIPGEKGPRRFTGAKFISAVSRVDLPAATLRRRMQDFSGYKHLFPMLTDSDVMALDGRKVVARYRLEIPLPALATIVVDFRIKHTIEADGSISALLIDGRAESLIAMLGGVTDELADQPVVSRWEILPVDARRSLLVFTYWDRVELKSFFARKFMEEYPEIRVVGPYIVAAGAAESIHRNFVSPVIVNKEIDPPGMEALAGMRYLINTLSKNGTVAVLEPEMAVGSPQKVAPLRYSALATRLHATPAVSRKLATQYASLPDVIKELKSVSVNDRGRQVDLGLDVRFAFMLLRFSLDLDVLNNWVTPDRLEFRRTAGNLAQMRGASEWYAVEGTEDTLMLTAAAHELGEDAPLLLRLAHRIVERVPYGDTLGGMAAHMVVMERMRPWIEKKAGSEKNATP